MRANISNLFYQKILTVSSLVVACVCVAVTGHAFGEAYSPPPFAHYQPILDRMPFGMPPANVPAAVDPATLKSEAQEKAEQQALAKKINMSAVNVTPDGKTAIGFTDLSVNPPVNYFLLVGAEAGGWTVLSADYDEESATIEKEGVTITLKLGKGLVAPAAVPPGRPAVTAPPGAPAAAGIAQMADPRVPRVGVTRVPMPMNPALPNPTAGQPGETRSYAERQLERASQQTAEQLAAKAEQQAQLEKLATEAAASAIKRREEETAQAAAEDPQAPQGQVQ